LRALTPLRALKTKAERGMAAHNFLQQCTRSKITPLFSQQYFAN
jgi:hypothetical protein